MRTESTSSTIRKVEPAAHDQLVRLVGHVIPQVIEANLGVGDVGYVRVVRLLPLLRLHVRLDDARTVSRKRLFTQPIHSASRLAR